MKVILRAFRDGRATIVGEATLDPDGSVRFAGEAAPRPTDPAVMDPETFEPLTPADGERYLRAMPFAFTGSYLRAELIA